MSARMSEPNRNDVRVVVTFPNWWVLKSTEPLRIEELRLDAPPPVVERDLLPESRWTATINELGLRIIRDNAWSQGDAWFKFNAAIRTVVRDAARKAKRELGQAETKIFWQDDWWQVDERLRDALFPLTFSEQLAKALADAERGQTGEPQP